MNKIFKHIGGNKFQLLTENVVIHPKTAEVTMLSNGLKKLFTEGVPTLSYNKLQNMGFGFIKDVHAAKDVALEESRLLADEFGYKDDCKNEQFVKNINESQYGAEDDMHYDGRDLGNSEENMSNSEEKREVNIGNEILYDVAEIYQKHPELVHDDNGESGTNSLRNIEKLARELIQLHIGQK